MRAVAMASVLSLMILSGCADAPQVKPYYTEDVLVVPESGWGKYWVRDESVMDGILRKTGGPPSPGGCFRMQAIIDSNGRLFDGKLVALAGDTDFLSWVMEFMAAQRFTPAYGNTHYTPIKTTLGWTFERFTTVAHMGPYADMTQPDIRWVSDDATTGGMGDFEARCEAIMDKQKN